jgi:hypothetical protein
VVGIDVGIDEGCEALDGVDREKSSWRDDDSRVYLYTLFTSVPLRAKVQGPSSSA